MPRETTGIVNTIVEDSGIDQTVDQDQIESQLEREVTMNLSPPTPFMVEGAKADDFTAWMKSYERWETAMELGKKAEAIQAATLITVLGPNVQKLMATLKLNSKQEADPKQVRQILNDYFKPKCNYTFERFEYNQMTQQPNEPVSEFVTRLKQQIQKCAYYCSHCENCSEITDMLLIDRLILGNKNPRIKERLLQSESLKLDRVVDIIRAAEDTNVKLREIEGKAEQEINRTHLAGERYKQKRPPNKPFHRRNSACGKCGGVHDRHNCPAKNKTCNKCKKLGHFARYCYSKGEKLNRIKIEQGSKVDNQKQSVVVSSVRCQRVTDDEMEVKVQLNGVERTILMDTGAESSLISEKELYRIGGHLQFKTNKVVTDYLRKFRTPAIAETDIKVQYGDRMITTRFVVIKEKCETILGKREVLDLKLITVNVR